MNYVEHGLRVELPDAPAGYEGPSGEGACVRPMQPLDSDYGPTPMTEGSFGDLTDSATLRSAPPKSP